MTTKEYYEISSKRKRSKTKCNYQSKYVGSIDCRDNCIHHKGYGKDEKGKFVICDFNQTKEN